jgi:hypothetical protein
LVCISKGQQSLLKLRALFVPTGSSTITDEGIQPEILYAVIGVLAIIAVIGVGAALMYRGKTK